MVISVLYLALLCGLAEAREATRASSATEVAALVSALSGSATVDQPRQTQLKLFDWVATGATVRVPRGSKMTLVLSNGNRFELTGPAHTTVSPTALSATKGTVTALMSVPRLPRLAPITNRKQEGRQSAAVRVRGPRIGNLHPSNGAVTRAGSTVLSFDAVAGAGEYAVEVEDGDGARIFQTQTETTRVTVTTPLKPDSRYYWRVRTVGRVGAQAVGEAEFRTLAADDEGAREALKNSLETADPHALGLLAHVDYELGLFREAREGVRLALEKGSGDPSLKAALLQLSRRLTALGVPGR